MYIICVIILLYIYSTYIYTTYIYIIYVCIVHEADVRRVCQYRGESTTAFNSVPVAGPAPPLEVPRHRLLPWEPAHFPTLLMGNVNIS